MCVLSLSSYSEQDNQRTDLVEDLPPGTLVVQDPVVQTQAASISRETAACEDSAVASSHSSDHGQEGTVRAQLEGGSRPAYHRCQNRGVQITKNNIQPKVHLVQQEVGFFFCFFVLFFIIIIPFKRVHVSTGACRGQRHWVPLEL